MGRADAVARKREFKGWMNRCPLRNWRQENEVAVTYVASQLGCSVSMVQYWERGVHVPGPENMAKIGALIGRADVASAWATWINRKPLAAA